MPLNFHMRLSDAQVAAIDEASHVTDARTGIVMTVTRQEVVNSIIEAWRAQQAPPPAGAAPASTLAVQPESAAASMGGPPSDQHAVKVALAERIRALRKAKTSYPKIVALFNDEPVPTLSGKPGAKWSTSSIVRLERFRG